MFGNLMTISYPAFSLVGNAVGSTVGDRVGRKDGFGVTSDLLSVVFRKLLNIITVYYLSTR